MSRPTPLASLAHMVGNTPLLAIDVGFRGVGYRVFAKAEHLNLTGSIKDRMALHVLRRATERDELTPSAPIAEATSGNTGIALAAIGRALGHPVTIFMPDWMSGERRDLMRSLGADIRLVSAREGGFLGSIGLAEEYAATTEGCFLPRQFANDDNPNAHYSTTAPEIMWQLAFEGLTPSAFLAGVGTGGTVMGVGCYLRERVDGVRVHPLEPSSSPTLSTGHRTGSHRIQGISDEFIPPIVDLDALDAIVAVHDGDAIIMAQRLAAELGLAVGISSGANLLGALLIAEDMGPSSTVVTVFPDDNKKYLSTDLLRNEPAAPGFLSPHITLEGFGAIKRVCFVCCEGEECGRAEAMDRFYGGCPGLRMQTARTRTQ